MHPQNRLTFGVHIKKRRDIKKFFNNLLIWPIAAMHLFIRVAGYSFMIFKL